MDINLFRSCCGDDTIQVTSHALKRCRERGITLDEIESCIMNGEIIEEYPNDYPFPSALIAEGRLPLHVVAGIGDNELWIITAYVPDRSIWNDDFKSRRESR